MTSIFTQTALTSYARPVLTSPPVKFLALLGLCSAYIQGPLMKIFDFNSAIVEMNHFGLSPAPPFAAGVIVFELAMSAMILCGYFRWAAAICLAGFTCMATLLALRFWEMPVGQDRTMATNGFFEHIGLVGAFVLVAYIDLFDRNISRRVSGR